MVTAAGILTHSASAAQHLIHYEMLPADDVRQLGLFYGTPSREIFAVNEEDWRSSNLLTIPFDVAEGYVGASIPPGAYTIRPGDTLYSIAARSKTPIVMIAAFNEIENVNELEAGSEIVIPNEIELRQMESGEYPLPGAPSPTVYDGKQIIVALSQQRTYAFEDGKLVRFFLVSTGLSKTPTIQGNYEIYRQLETRHMTGPGYDLPDVPYVSYFIAGYAFHGTYWHENFGTPMSHGCVNMVTDEARWLYEWAEIGTPVRVIP